MALFHSYSNNILKDSSYRQGRTYHNGGKHSHHSKNQCFQVGGNEKIGFHIAYF